MRRIYMLLPDLGSCRSLVDSLREYGVADRHMHVVASLAHGLQDLPKASVWQTTELAKGIEIGTGLGGAAGLLGGLLALSVPPAGLVLGGGAVMASTVAGAGFGALVSALMKGHEHNHKLDRYQHEIEAGKILLLVDISRSGLDAIQERVLALHPGVKIEVALPKASG